MISYGHILEIYEKFIKDNVPSREAAEFTKFYLQQQRDLDHELSHEICLGVRKGLFGADAGNNASILDLQIGVSND